MGDWIEVRNNGRILHGVDANGNRVHRIIWEDHDGNEYCMKATAGGMNFLVPVQKCKDALGGACFIV